MSLCGLTPVAVAVFTMLRIEEPVRWEGHSHEAEGGAPLIAIFGRRHLRRALVNSVWLTIANIGLWAAWVDEPAAANPVVKYTGYAGANTARLVFIATATLWAGTIPDCFALPLDEALGRQKNFVTYFAIIFGAISAASGRAFYFISDVMSFTAIPLR